MSLGSQGAKAGWGGADGQDLPKSLWPRWVIKGEASVVKKAGRGEGRGDKDKRKKSLFLSEGRGPLEDVG